MVAFVASTVLTAANLNSAFNQKTINTQTGTTYTLVLTDQGGVITTSNASAVTVTIPPFASVAFATGTIIDFVNLGAGTLTIDAGAGVTISGTITALATNESASVIKTATNTWSYLAPSSPGLSLITPTSVAGSGVTLSGGQVTFTAASSVSLNGCFTATYNNYRILVSGLSSASDSYRARLRLAGTDATAATYTHQRIAGSVTTVSTVGGSTDTFFYVGDSDTTVSAWSIDMFNPALAVATQHLTLNLRTPRTVQTIVGLHTTDTAYDGITFFPPSGTITGSLRVYGYRNS